MNKLFTRYNTTIFRTGVDGGIQTKNIILKQKLRAGNIFFNRKVSCQIAC